MADESKNLFGGFEAIADQFLSPKSLGKLSNDDDNEPIVTPDELKKRMEDLDNDNNDNNDSDDIDVNKDIDKDDESKKKSDTTASANDKNKKKNEETKSKQSSTKVEPTKPVEEEEVEDNNNDSQSEDVDIEEEELVNAFSDLFADELGWEFDGDEKPKSIKDLVDYMQDVIETNSQPKYASDEIKDLDEFVKKGGNVKEYFSKLYSPEIDIDKLDISKESNQKAVIRENLRTRGYSEARIDKLITRYEETGALEEEAKDSYEEVKEYRDKTKQELLDNQRKQHEESTRQQLKFVQDVESIITNAKDVRGISISDKEKKALIEYIFKPTSDGLTGYQKDYNSNLKNLVESAFFTMKKDTFVQQIEKKASSNAVKDLKLKLKTRGKSTKNTASDIDDSNSKVTQLWELASKELKSFN